MYKIVMSWLAVPLVRMKCPSLSLLISLKSVFSYISVMMLASSPI